MNDILAKDACFYWSLSKILKFFEIFEILRGLGAIRAKIGPTSDVDKIFSSHDFFARYIK
jgi:hypothetical protein